MEWTETHQKVLCELIDVLTSSKVMSFPNFEKPFVLQSDASQDGLGAIVYQAQDDGHLAVIAYGSRTLTPAEQRYYLHSGKLEFLALKWAVTERFRDYLYYAPSVDVYTDNNPLTYVMTTAKLDAVRHRWVAELADFKFKNHYKPGRLNSDADTLSRMSLDVEQYIRGCTRSSSKEVLMAMVEAASAEMGEQPLWVNIKEVGNLGAEVNEMTGIKTLKSEDIVKLQDKDLIMGKVRYHVMQQVKPTKSQMRSEPVKLKTWLRDWGRLQVGSDGVLRRSCKMPDGQKILQVCVPPELHHLVYEEPENGTFRC